MTTSERAWACDRLGCQAEQILERAEAAEAALARIRVVALQYGRRHHAVDPETMADRIAESVADLARRGHADA